MAAISSLILPISVCTPVATTTPIALPAAMFVPCAATHKRPGIKQLAESQDFLEELVFQGGGFFYPAIFTVHPVIQNRTKMAIKGNSGLVRRLLTLPLVDRICYSCKCAKAVHTSM